MRNLGFVSLILALSACSSSSIDALVGASSAALTPGAPAPVLVQSHYGLRGDFALLLPAPAGGLEEYVRSNDNAPLPWRGPQPVGRDPLPNVDAVTAVQANASLHDEIHAVARIGEGLASTKRDPGMDTPWTSPLYFGAGARGTPSLVQGKFGTAASNFELAVPSTSGGVALYWLDNDKAQSQWAFSGITAQSLGVVDDVSLLASDYASNLEMVVRVGNTLHTFWRDSSPLLQWTEIPFAGTGASGNPVLVQDAAPSGAHGDFELVVPSVEGGLDAYRKDNALPNPTWSAPTRVFADMGPVDSISLVRSNYASDQLELILRAAGRLMFAWRDQAGWHGPFVLQTPGAPQTALHKSYTEHLGTLTKTDDLARVGLTGTDLGAAFESQGHLRFLFGDAWSNDPSMKDDDSTALTDATHVAREAMPTLTWATQGNRFAPIAVPGMSGDLKGMNVPTDGIETSTGDYVFLDSGYVPGENGGYGQHTTSILAHFASSLPTLVLDHQVASAKFINISAVEDQGYVYLWGSGAYRQSDVYLARAKVADLPFRGRWEYLQSDAGAPPAYGAGEDSARPLFRAGCIGELSVRKHPTLNLFLMTYNCDAPPGVFLRTSSSADGPWSDPAPLFEPTNPEDHVYGSFTHMAPVESRADDGLSEVGRESESGGFYGPYLVPRWFTDDAPGVHSLVYTLSSWNPYRAHLMRTVLTENGAIATRPLRGASLPRASLVNGDFARGDLSGWSQSGDGFAVFTGADGAMRVSTYTASKGDRAMGLLSQSFAVDASTRELRFLVHGGSASVRLKRGTEVLRETHGPHANSPEQLVVWRLEDFQGQTLTLEIVDTDTAPWGFIGTSGFELR